MPMYLFKGYDILHYTGNIYYNIDKLPNDYDKKLDLYIDCDCQYVKWKYYNKIIK